MTSSQEHTASAGQESTTATANSGSSSMSTISSTAPLSFINPLYENAASVTATEVDAEWQIYSSYFNANKRT